MGLIGVDRHTLKVTDVRTQGTTTAGAVGDPPRDTGEQVYATSDSNKRVVYALIGGLVLLVLWKSAQ